MPFCNVLIAFILNIAMLKGGSPHAPSLYTKKAGSKSRPLFI